MTRIVLHPTNKDDPNASESYISVTKPEFDFDFPGDLYVIAFGVTNLRSAGIKYKDFTHFGQAVFVRKKKLLELRDAIDKAIEGKDAEV